MHSYEELRSLIVALDGSSRGDTRDVRWLSAAQVVGVARDAKGSLEVFLRGEKLRPAAESVARSVDYRTFYRQRGLQFEANRILLPPFGHFDQVAALICAELFNADADGDLVGAFAAVEPLIDLALVRAVSSGEVVTGLAGELLLLDALCRRSAPSRRSDIVFSWDGWRRSERDFQLNGIGVEVKTTTGDASSHLVGGVHQVEPLSRADSTSDERRLMFVSIGLQFAEDSRSAFSVPLMVGRIAALIEDAGLGADVVDRFLSRVSEYGAGYGVGYDHALDSGDPRWATAFNVAFFRGYDMDVPEVRVLRSSDLVEHSHVDSSSLSFRVNLPSAVGLGNPLVGLSRVTDYLVAASLPGDATQA